MFSCFNFSVDEFRGNTCCLLKPSGSFLESTMSIPLSLISHSRQSHLSCPSTPKIAHDLIIPPAYVLLSYALLILHFSWKFFIGVVFLAQFGTGSSRQVHDRCEQVFKFAAHLRSGSHSIKMPAPLFHSSPSASCVGHLRGADKACCLAAGASHHLPGVSNLIHYHWLTWGVCNFQKGKKRVQTHLFCQILIVRVCFSVWRTDCIFRCDEPFTAALPAGCLLPHFHRCFEWETPSLKDLIPVICVVF